MAGASVPSFETASIIGTATGVGVAEKVFAGAIATGTAAGAVNNAVAGGTAAAGVGSTGTGLGAVVATVGIGGWGLVVIGTSVNSEENLITYGCWKPVVHDTSVEPSNGMLLKDMVGHAHIANLIITARAFPELHNTAMENIWNETFEIEYLFAAQNRK